MKKYKRLYTNQVNIGIGPWDQGDFPYALKLAVQAIMMINDNTKNDSIDNIAVSNSYLWSFVNDNNNDYPYDSITGKMKKIIKKIAIDYWKQIYKIIDFNKIICVGRQTEKVQIKATNKNKICFLFFPGTRNLGRIKGTRPPKLNGDSIGNYVKTNGVKCFTYRIFLKLIKLLINFNI